MNRLEQLRRATELIKLAREHHEAARTEKQYILIAYHRERAHAALYAARRWLR